MNILSRTISAITFLGLVLALMPACSKKPVKPVNLHKLIKTADYEATQRMITLKATKLTDKQTAQLFKGNKPCIKQRKNHRKRKSKPADTLVFSIINNGQNTISLTKDTIKLPLVDYQNIVFSKNLSFSSYCKALGFGLIPILAIPGCVLITFYTLLITNSTILSGSTLISMLLYSVPTGLAVGACTTGAFLLSDNYNENNKQEQQYNRHRSSTLADTIIIKPQQRKEFICFIPQDSLPHQFALTVNDAQTNLPLTTFAVILDRHIIEDQK